MQLNERVIVVTGGSGALGRLLCRAFAADGARVVVGCHGNPAAADEIVAEIRHAAGQATRWQADITDPVQAEALVAHAEATFGRVDVMFNNAGGLIRRGFLDISPDLWRQQLAANLDGAFYCTQAAARRMVAGRIGGKIINMSSIAGSLTTPSYVPYCVAKAALNELTRSSAAALAPHGITVNALAPGTVETDRVKARLTRGENRARLLARTPAGRLLQPGDLVGVAMFLVSHESDHLTGQVLTVDHGFTLVGVQWEPEETPA